MSSKPFGYFCYARMNGTIVRSKRHADHGSVERTHQRTELASFPLSELEFDTLSLDELERKHPRPIENPEPVEH